jgi:hypothetical protein
MILNYLTQKQALDEWCWAAVASSISFFYNRNSKGYPQADIAARLIGSQCSGITTANRGTADPSCNVTGDVAKALGITGNLAWDIPRHLDLNEITDQINQGFPFCCQIDWNLTGKSHFVCVYGYEHTRLVVGDSESRVCTVDYQQFLNYRQGAWRRTIGTRQA